MYLILNNSVNLKVSNYKKVEQVQMSLWTLYSNVSNWRNENILSLGGTARAL